MAQRQELQRTKKEGGTLCSAYAKPRFKADPSLCRSDLTNRVGHGEVCLGLVATLVLVLMMPRGTLPCWWSVAGFIAVALMHMVLWTITQPVHRRWFAGVPLTGAARRFFSAVGKKAHGTIEVNQQDQWES